MSFTNPTFLYYFLPLFLVIYWLTPESARARVLLGCSIFNYLWGDTIHAPLILLLLIINYRLANLMLLTKRGGQDSQRLMRLGLLVNIGLLIGIKLYSAYGLRLMVTLDYPIASDQWQMINSTFLPLGLSFISFQAVALLIDIDKGRIHPAGSDHLALVDFLLYLMMFPKVIAGPITRFTEFSSQFKKLSINLNQISGGMERFIQGLAKKIIIADQLAPVVDSIFSLGIYELTTSYAWLGLIGYSLQIYFDFWGYTDMAIGVGLMIGLKLPENFNAPYLATSIVDFWRRWHITLSNWFRDYLFFPLERHRRGKSNLWQYANILIVFLFTGLWHGVTINYILWGMLHGLAIIFETSPYGQLLKKSNIVIQRLYTLIVIFFGWVLFRSKSLEQTGSILKALVGLDTNISPIQFEKLPIVGGFAWIALMIGIIFCLPIGDWLINIIKNKMTPALPPWIVQLGSKLILIATLFICLIIIAASNYHPTLYAKF